MSIFGNLGGMLGNLVEQHGGTEAILQGALQQAGGVQGIVSKLQGAGYGDAVQSWLGAGPNQPVTADGIAQALGHGRIGEMAAGYGLQPDQLSGLLAKVLPGLIDRLSPDGTLQPHLLQGAQGGAAPSPLDPAS